MPTRARALRFALALLPCTAMTGLAGRDRIFDHLSCAHRDAPLDDRTAADDRRNADRPPTQETPQTVTESDAVEPAKEDPPTPPPSPRDALHAWLVAHVPTQDTKLVDDGDRVSVVHVAAHGESFLAIARAYLAVTDAWKDSDLAAAIARTNPMLHAPLAEGAEVTLPRVVTEVPKAPTEARLSWPEDRAIRGIYVTAQMMKADDFPQVLDRLAAHGMNAVVVDVKDVTGWFTAPSTIPLALETDANKYAIIPSFERLVRLAHTRGIRVLARIACFRDEHLAPTKKDLAIVDKHGNPHRGPSHAIDWLDPANETVRGYLYSIVSDAIAAGADEIQLDYVRFPTEGIYDADFRLEERGLTTVSAIAGFVEKVHAITQAAHVPLSLDVFGCVAWGNKPDVEATGQDLRQLGKHVEALSPMVYPSHFGEGFNGYDIPGDHPDVVAIGTQHAVDLLHKAGIDNVVVRPWIQAFPYKSPHFGSPYVAAQMKEAANGGGVGWLAWNSGGEYGATFAATPLVKKVLAKK